MPRATTAPPATTAIPATTAPPARPRSRLSTFDGPNSIPASTIGFQVMFDALGGYSPGKYVATAKFSITPTGSGEVSCNLYPYGSTSGDFDTVKIVGSGIEQSVTLIAANDYSASVASRGFIVRCDTPAGTSAVYKYGRISAVQTGDYTITGG